MPSNRCPVTIKWHFRSVFSWKFKANSYDEGCSTSCLQIMNLKTAFWVVRTPSSCSYQQSRRQITSWPLRSYKTLKLDVSGVLMGENNHSLEIMRRHYEHDRCNKACAIMVMENRPFGTIIKTTRATSHANYSSVYSRLW